MAADADGIQPGMCSAFGCPLFGSMAEDSGGKWFCFCHVRKPRANNDAITACLRRHMWLVRITRDIRQFERKPNEWASVLGGIDMILREQKRVDLMLGEIDSSPERLGRPLVSLWLQRLEGTLIDFTFEAGEQALINSHTAPVTGPTHAEKPFAETDA